MGISGRETGAGAEWGGERTGEGEMEGCTAGCVRCRRKPRVGSWSAKVEAQASRNREPPGTRSKHLEAVAEAVGLG